jgi:hypothetical protein
MPDSISFDNADSHTHSSTAFLRTINRLPLTDQLRYARTRLIAQLLFHLLEGLSSQLREVK